MAGASVGAPGGARQVALVGIVHPLERNAPLGRLAFAGSAKSGDAGGATRGGTLTS